MPTASFFVNTVNEPPTSPVVSSPANDAHVATLTPVISITNATDVDILDTATYDFDVATDSDFSTIIANIISQPQGTGGITSWPTPTLSEDTPYYWRARVTRQPRSNERMGNFFVFC